MNITLDSVVPTLLAACPTALPAWHAHLQWWGAEAPGHFNDVSVFSHHVVDSFATGSTTEFPAFFCAVERLISEGDEKVKELAVIGLLEDIQNVASHRPFGNAVFQPWLGPASRQQWAALEAVWEGHGSLMDVLRAETRAKG